MIWTKQYLRVVLYSQKAEGLFCLVLLHCIKNLASVFCDQANELLI